MAKIPNTVIIACGALAREITALIRASNWQHMHVQCLPAKLHNTPGAIAPAVQAKINELKAVGYTGIFVAYADCGTGGELDRVLEAENIERLPGPHCYSFFAGATAFDALHKAEFGAFYLTDFLARHFDRLILGEMGINEHPELLPMYFGNYKKLVYLAQTDDPALVAMAQAAAERLGLTFERHHTGYGELEDSMHALAERTTEEPITWRA